jgi:hypothetical protein
MYFLGVPKHPRRCGILFDRQEPDLFIPLLAEAEKTRPAHTAVTPIYEDKRLAESFRLLLREIDFVSNGVNLSRKDIADARCRLLQNDPIWGDAHETAPRANLAWIRHLQPADHGPFDYWKTWYSGLWSDKPEHGQLATSVALIPDADWDAGPEHLATKIAQIEAELLAEKLPLAETVEINPQTGRFRAVPIAVQNAPLLGAVLGRVSDALDDALQGNNGLNERAREVRVITRTVQRYGNDPQRIEMDFTALAVGLRRQFEVQDLPRSEDNLALLDAVEDSVRAIRATHPEVADNRAILARQSLQELTEAERDTLAAALPVLQDISEGPLPEDFAEDIAEMLAPRLPSVRRDDPGGSAPPVPGEMRVFSRVSKMAMLADGIRTIDNSAGYKGVRIATTAASAVGILFALVQIGVRLFGVL